MRRRSKTLWAVALTGGVMTARLVLAAGDEQVPDAPEPGATVPGATVTVADYEARVAPSPPRVFVSDAPAPRYRLASQPTTIDQPEEPVAQPSGGSLASDAGASNGSSSGGGSSGGFGGFVDLNTAASATAPGSTAISSEQQAIASTAPADVVLGSEADVRNTSDSNDLLVRSATSTGIYVHSRNQISNDTRVRGYRFSQIRSDIHGANWQSIRPDFDTPLSKLDSSLIRDVVVVKGPYNVRQGPGFAFINVELQDTLRSECGCSDWSGRTSFVWDTNGDQFNGRQTINLAQESSGMRVSYGNRGGTDYNAGDDHPVAGGYHSQDWDFAYGWTLSPDSTLQFNYQRIDQTDIELPSQYFDVDGLVADGFSLRYMLENQERFDKLRADVWWNRTRFSGNADNLTKPGIFNNPFGLSALANNGNIGEVRSVGGRVAVTWGEDECPQLTVGTDYSLYDQEYIETADRFFGSFGMPRSVVDDIGVFVDVSLPITDRFRIRPGARLDFVDVSPSIGLVAPNAQDIDREYNLHNGNITGEYDVSDVWTLKLGAGYAERNPTPTDLYTRTFLEILQPGGDLDFRGNGNLAKEKLWQLDAGAVGTFADARVGVNFFVGWIDDYITYQSPFGLLMNTVNTDAQIAGGEAFLEYQLNDRWTTFGTISYVQAKDEIRSEPLWGIPPLDGRVGLRYQPGRWGMEFTARIVDDQDRLATAIFGGRPELATPGFTTLDLRGFYKFNDRVRLVGGVENLNDRNYLEHLDSRADLSYGNPIGVFRPGINGYVGAIVTY